MDTAREALQPDRFVLDTDWDGYMKLSDVVGERPIRVTYDRGRLELMTVSCEHEQMKSILRSLLEALMEEREIDFLQGGNMTFRRQDLDRGLEPDECYWLKNWTAMRKVREYDSLVQPPPDLVLEVDVSRSSIDRIAMFAALGVPEVWRYRRSGELEVRVLDEGGRYALVAASPALGGYEPARLVDFVADHPDLSTSGLLRAFRRTLS